MPNQQGHADGDDDDDLAGHGRSRTPYTLHPIPYTLNSEP
jgi:hypothetical protein